MGMIKEFKDFAMRGNVMRCCSKIAIEASRCPQCTSDLG